MDSPNCVAILPARSGSKRIPGKNIKPFMGRPVISIAISKALGSGIFKRVIVSTDSEEIAQISKDSGAEILELRPLELAGDLVSTMDVIRHEIDRLKFDGDDPEHVACIYPATPLLDVTILQECYMKLRDSQSEFCIPVVRNHVNSERLFELDNDFSIKESSLARQNLTTQNYKNQYRDAGQFYLGKTSAWMNLSNVFTSSTLAHVIPEYLGIDIDSIEDWKHAELIYAGMEKLDSSNFVNIGN